MAQGADYKSLLGLYFGVFIRMLRERNGITFKQFGEVLGGFVPSYIRFIENGDSAISPSRAFDLLQGLNSQFSMEVVLSPISNLLVGIHHTSGNGVDLKEVESRIIQLRNADQTLEKLIRPLLYESVWSQYERRNYEGLQKTLSEDPFYFDSLKSYLEGRFETELLGGATKLSRIWEVTPSTYNDFLNIELRSLQDKINVIRHIGSNYSLESWERFHRSKLARQYAVFQTKHQLTEYKGTGTEFFDWSYLVEQQASEFYCVVIDSLGDVAELITEEIISTIHSCMRKDLRNNSSIRADLKKKIRVVTSPEAFKDRLMSVLDTQRIAKNVTEWIFYELTDSSAAGFYSSVRIEATSKLPLDQSDAYESLSNLECDRLHAALDMVFGENPTQ